MGVVSHDRHPGGRPRIYESLEELEQAIEDYFFPEQDIIGVSGYPTGEKKKIRISKPSVTGLALALGFADKTTLYEYRDRPEFSYPIKRSLTMIEQWHEERLSENSVAGAIFALKNMGWKDKTETDLNHSGTAEWSVVMKRPDGEHITK